MPKALPVRIDFAAATDLEPLANLLAELFALEADFQPDRQKQLRGLRLILDNPQAGRIFVLRVDGEVAGMAVALFSISTAEGARVIVLEDFTVAHAERGRGYGRQLAEHVLAWASAEGCARVSLLADKDNAAALAFYGRLGFTGSNMLVLRRPL